MYILLYISQVSENEWSRLDVGNSHAEDVTLYKRAFQDRSGAYEIR
jgi:hypothetical protein